MKLSTFKTLTNEDKHTLREEFRSSSFFKDCVLSSAEEGIHYDNEMFTNDLTEWLMIYK